MSNKKKVTWPDSLWWLKCAASSDYTAVWHTQGFSRVESTCNN